jgi:uncharacterized protein YcfJ
VTGGEGEGVMTSVNVIATGIATVTVTESVNENHHVGEAGVRTVRRNVCRKNESVRSNDVKRKKRNASVRLRMPRVVIVR